MRPLNYAVLGSIWCVGVAISIDRGELRTATGQGIAALCLFGIAAVEIVYARRRARRDRARRGTIAACTQPPPT